jgi:hypothetical protein
MAEINKKYEVLNDLKEEYLNEIKLIYVFEDEDFADEVMHSLLPIMTNK